MHLFIKLYYSIGNRAALGSFLESIIRKDLKCESIQSYVNRLKDQLPDDESKARVDTLIPPTAVKMLHKRLTGRFRPIVTAIEAILATGGCDGAIDRIETLITSWEDRWRRGNLLW